MKKLGSIAQLMLIITVFLAFTAPSEKDFETHIKSELKETNGEGFLGINDVIGNIFLEAIKLNSEYKDLKIGSTYRFNLSNENNFKYVGFGTLIFKVSGNFENLNLDTN